ncbi:MAG: type II 3-dehydroquinate dehydratase [Tractidigestivibacter sp.]|jgi:3-dehydroquinate dehydratase-2|uniref:type II 3-dehydroquinate dehydratase n=1 Tax=Tractidigestivibacter sp. TaxID=2847320 RepID=UPI003D8A955D
MTDTEVARLVLEAVGGKDNVTANDLCMTRLRIMTAHPSLIDTERIDCIPGVLGYARRGTNGIEIVFGPGSVKSVYESLESLTGIEANISPFLGVSSESSSPIRVQISGHAPTPSVLRRHAMERRAEEADERAAKKATEGDSSDVDDLVSLLERSEEEEDPDFDDDFRVEGDGGRRVLVINGPNINMLGVREPAIYGRKTYDDLVQICKETAREVGFADCRCFQSNHEGDLVDAIQSAYEDFDGIVINPAAYTHTSVAILDAVKAVALPCVEVHISKVDEREEFRQVSYIRAACFKTEIGKGLDGYRCAIRDLWDYLEEHSSNAEKGAAD